MTGRRARDDVHLSRNPLATSALLLGLCGACSSSKHAAPDASYNFGSLDAGQGSGFDAGPDAYVPTATEKAAFQSLLGQTSTILAAAGAPGASIAIVLHGRLAFAEGVGKKDLSTGEPVTTSTLFGAGSMSKTVTAATAFAEKDRGKLVPDAPVTQYLPWLKLSSGPVPASFTTASLLSMTSGFAADTVGFCGSPDTATTGSRATFFTNNPLPLWFPPGAAYVYSNTGYSLMATIIEAAAGVGDGQFEQLASSLVMVPSGMTTATFDMRAAAAADHATGYALDSSLKVVETFEPTTPELDCPMLDPAGGLFATAIDFARLIEMLLANGGTVLAPASVTAMETSVIDENDFPGVRFGEGLEQWTWPGLAGGHTIQRKDGDLPGYISVLQFVPNLGFGVVALVNAGGGEVPTADDISYAALQLFLPGTDLTIPTMTTPSPEWAPYVGTYDDPWGWLGRGVSVKLGAGKADAATLFIDAPHAHLGAISGAMQQEFPQTWLLPNGWEATFFGPNAGPATYFATRLGVGAREADAAVDARRD